MSNGTDFISKALIGIQIAITASVIPIGSIYLHTVSDFNNLVYGASGLILISNIDNFFAELLKLQIDKNHKVIP